MSSSYRKTTQKPRVINKTNTPINRTGRNSRIVSVKRVNKKKISCLFRNPLTTTTTTTNKCTSPKKDIIDAPVLKNDAPFIQTISSWCIKKSAPNPLTGRPSFSFVTMPATNVLDNDDYKANALAKWLGRRTL